MAAPKSVLSPSFPWSPRPWKENMLTSFAPVSSRCLKSLAIGDQLVTCLLLAVSVTVAYINAPKCTRQLSKYGIAAILKADLVRSITSWYLLYIIYYRLSLLLVSRFLANSRTEFASWSEFPWGRIRHNDQRHEAPSLGHDKHSVLQSFAIFVCASPRLEHLAYKYVQQQRSYYIYIYIYYIEVSTIVFTTDPSSQRYQWFPTSLVVKVCGWKLILTCIKARCKQPAICWWQIPAVQVWPLRYQAPGSYVSCDYCNRHLAQTWKARSCVINTVYGLQLRYV